MKELSEKARKLRVDILEMTTRAGSGHPGGSLSSAEIITALYFNKMKHDPKNPNWEQRDRFVLSKGHSCPVVYAALAETGYFPREKLKTLRKLGSMLQGHPDAKRTPGAEFSTGSLGLGLSHGNGVAIALRDKGLVDSRVYVLMGDGELQEGQVWEAATTTAHRKLNNV
ncbi:transketolase, partial [Candidatus Micrarchaeota archaeon]|nr:transketolase [Candidatus Micrarchaeota archaeon]